MVKRHSLLIKVELTAVGEIETKAVVDYFRNRDKQEIVDEDQGNQQVILVKK